MKVCDKCRKEIKKGSTIFEFELCESCVNYIKEWVKKPVKKGFNMDNLFGGNN